MPKTTIAYDRQTVNMVFELKRSLPVHEQADFRISSPDLLKRVKDIYRETNRADTKTLAKRLLQAISVISTSDKSATRYRGVARADASGSDATGSSAAEPQKKKMYRGLVVDY